MSEMTRDDAARRVRGQLCRERRRAPEAPAASSEDSRSATSRPRGSRTRTSRGSRRAHERRPSRRCASSRRSSASRSSTSRPARTSARLTSASFASPTPSSSSASPRTSSAAETKLDADPRRGARSRRSRVRGTCARSPSASPPRIAATISTRSSASKQRSRDEHAPPPHLRPDVYATLGQSYAALGAPDRAVQLFERCLERGRGSRAGGRCRSGPLRDLPELRADAMPAITTAPRTSCATRWHSADDARPIPTRASASTGRSRASHGMDGRSGEALEYIRSAIALLEATDDTLQLGARAICSRRASSPTRATERRARAPRPQRSVCSAPHAEPVDRRHARASASRGSLRSRATATARSSAHARRSRILGDFHGGEQGSRRPCAGAAAWRSRAT